MKALFLNCRQYKAQKDFAVESMKDCLSVLICIEIGDDNKQVKRIVKDIEKYKKFYHKKNLLLGPFGHLSNRLAKADDAKKILSEIEKKVKLNFSKLLVSDFGVEKGLFLNIIKAPYNIIFRQY